MDAGLGKLINSTLGTSDIVPLDKLLLRQKRIVASTEEYCRLGYSMMNVEITATRANPTVEEKITSFEMLSEGTFSLEAIVNRHSTYAGSESGSNYRINLSVYKNGTFLTKKIYESYNNSMVGDTTLSIPLIEVLAGDRIEVRLGMSLLFPSSNYSAKVILHSPLKILATVKDNTLTLDEA